MSVSHSHSLRMQPTAIEAVEAVIRVPADRQIEALEQLISGSGDPGRESAVRFQEYAQQNRIDLGTMWATTDQRGRFERVLLAVPAPGRTAMVFITRPTRASDVQPSALLIDSASKAMGQFGIALAQVLIDPRESREQQSFEAGGFTRLAELSYLERSIPSPKLAPQPNWPDGVTVEACVDPTDPVWATTLEQTYVGTLDCPGLLGLRNINDVIAGHQAVGAFEAGLWTLLRVDGAPAGVLLLNPTPASRSIELVYLGLAPSARGRGLGCLLLEHGLSLVAGRSERVITLAVDEQNQPALRLYSDAGFHPMLRRTAYIRSI